MIGLSWILVN